MVIHHHSLFLVPTLSHIPTQVLFIPQSYLEDATACSIHRSQQFSLLALLSFFLSLETGSKVLHPRNHPDIYRCSNIRSRWVGQEPTWIHMPPCSISLCPTVPLTWCGGFSFFFCLFLFSFFFLASSSNVF